MVEEGLLGERKLGLAAISGSPISHHPWLPGVGVSSAVSLGNTIFLMHLNLANGSPRISLEPDHPNDLRMRYT